MEKENFIKWFKRKGYRKYTLPMIIALVINYGVFIGNGGIYSAFKDPEIPIFVWICTFVIYLGFHIGMTWHILEAFKNERQ